MLSHLLLTGNNNMVNVYMRSIDLSSVLRRCWLGGRKGIRPVKN